MRESPITDADDKENSCETVGPALPALPPAAPARPPLVPERSDFLEGDAPAADKVAAFLARALEATGGHAPAITAALVPWVCDALQSNHSVKAYHRDLTDFFRHMQAQGVTPLEVTADHVKLYVRFVASFRPVMRYAKEASAITRCPVSRPEAFRPSFAPNDEGGAIHKPRTGPPRSGR